MVLLSATLILALIFGAYTSSLITPNVNRVLLTSMILYGGMTGDNITQRATSSMIIVLRNPGLTTNITSIWLHTSSLQAPLVSWSNVPGPAQENSFFSGTEDVVLGGTATSSTIYPVYDPPSPILSGETFEYIITFGNGQSLSGAILAQ